MGQAQLSGATTANGAVFMHDTVWAGANAPHTPFGGEPLSAGTDPYGLTDVQSLLDAPWTLPALEAPGLFTDLAAAPL